MGGRHKQHENRAVLRRVRKQAVSEGRVSEFVGEGSQSRRRLTVTSRGIQVFSMWRMRSELDVRHVMRENSNCTVEWASYTSRTIALLRCFHASDRVKKGVKMDA